MSSEKRKGPGPSHSSHSACRCTDSEGDKTSGLNKHSKMRPCPSGVDNEAFEADASDLCSDAHEGAGLEPKASNTDTTENGGTGSSPYDATGTALEFQKEGRALAAGTEDDCVECAESDVVDKSDVVPETADSLQKVRKVETSLKKWVTGTNFIVYVSHSLSAWGDRMWSFGVGLFLVNIASQNLQLPAVYGLASCLTIFFLGATVGNWVDHTPRLKAAKLSLVLQNVFVVICAAGVYAFLWFHREITEGEHQAWLEPLCQAGIIVVAIVSRLASLTRMIAVERDWIVEICGGDKDMLATMTSALRRIDQGTLILAPIATGQIMTYGGLKNGAVFIAAWNVGSVFIEYYLIWKVYNTVPALRAKKELCRTDKTPPTEAEEDAEVDAVAETPNDALTCDNNGDLTSGGNNNGDAQSGVLLSDANKTDEEEDKVTASPASHVEQEEGKPNAEEQQVVIEEERSKESGCCHARICSGFLTLYRGWRTYMRYSVALAGLALACLYMTVLGFDNITVAYAVTQGVSESILGILMGVSAVFGILGTFAYPVLRRRLGLMRTGIFALSSQVACLTLCVVSIWMPGSPFDPLYLVRQHEPVDLCNYTTSALPVIMPLGNKSASAYNISGSPMLLDNNTGSGNLTDCNNSDNDGPQSYMSVGLLMGGIVLARFGLWVADLTITQLFLEVVVEGERGVVNGVQSSLNKLMDVLKFVLVVAVPDTQTFGFLIIVSFTFICLGWLSYAIFLRRNRGHFFHFQKCSGCGNGHAVSEAA